MNSKEYIQWPLFLGSVIVFVNRYDLALLPFINHQINWFITKFLITLSPIQIIYSSPNQMKNRQIHFLLTKNLNFCVTKLNYVTLNWINSYSQPWIAYSIALGSQKFLQNLKLTFFEESLKTYQKGLKLNKKCGKKHWMILIKTST